jgi:hypothetical protein
MTYKRETTTVLAIAIIAAAMISGSVMIALTLVTEGVGVPQAHACKKGDNTASPGPCGVPRTTRERA